MLFAIFALAPLVPHVQAQNAVPLWTNYYDGPVSGNDFPNALAVDHSGNVFVTGNSIGILGHPGASGTDWATVAYSSTGVPLWTNRYNGPGDALDYPRAIAVDGNGNVIVAGQSVGSGSIFEKNADFATIKYSGGGVPLWTNRYNGPAKSGDLARVVAVDTNGNVLVSGISDTGFGTNYDFATIKYSSAGVPLWTNRYHGPGSGFDYPYALATDTGGNAIVTGGSAGINGDYDYVTIKYSSAGARLWTNRYDGPGHSSDSASAVAADADGNVFVTGSSGFPTNVDSVTIKYSSAGIPLWTNRYDSPDLNNAATALAVDSTGNAFVAVSSTDITNNSYVRSATIKYSSAGVAIWTNCNNYGGNQITLRSNGVVLVSGISQTTAFSSSGVPLWTNFYPASGAYLVWAVIDDSNNAVMMGQS
ncbi:MAG TPA: SBBP repeat-containing protein, partial [Verrucomicrobiae bacterium]|nr:SBBP repeat-containing protein [Verrucomicrobiae bacterium]